MPRPRAPVYSSPEERDGLRAASRFNASLLDHLRPLVVPGTTTKQIDAAAHEYTTSHGHTPATLGYQGAAAMPYPASVCTSVNDVVCHGIPDDRPLEEGDIVNVDCTTIVDGWFGDSSETFMVGGRDAVEPRTLELVQITHDCLWAGIDAIQPGGRVIDISQAIYRLAKKERFAVVRQFQGHGLGRKFHQRPDVPHFPTTGAMHEIISPGVCFTIEPMINIGTWKAGRIEDDGWTVRTADNKLSAQFEHTILMTEDGPEVLTLTENGPQRGHTF